MTELCDLSATELRALIGKRTASPVEILRSCKARIEALNPSINAIPTLAFEQAEKSAREAESAMMNGAELGALHGLPAAIKDLSATAGLKTTYGSRIFANHVPTEDDSVVAAIRAEGAVVIGKTNTPEFGAGANTTNLLFGPTRNPYAPHLIVGGSSGGAAAALATRMVPIANGSDRGGSLRIPASFCGVVGFRPSPGMIAFDRRVMGWIPLCVEGPMGRTVGDVQMLFHVLRGAAGSDPLASVTDRCRTRSPRGLDKLRVAFSEDLGFALVEPVIRQKFREVIKRFGNVFADCVEATPQFGDADRTFEVLRGIDFVGSYETFYRENRALLDKNVVSNVEEALKFTLADAARALREQTLLFRRMEAFFTEFDLLICPTVSVLPFAIERNHPESVDGMSQKNYFHWLGLTYGLTLTAQPVISMPCSAIQGLPFGIQLVSALRADEELLRWAEQLEGVFRSSAELSTPGPPLPPN